MGIMKVEVTKAKAIMEIDTKDLPDPVYQEALRQGLKVLLNRGMTKITKEFYPVAEELIKVAMEKATTTLADMKAGKIRIVGGGKDKVSGVVKTEAMKIARALVKDELKRQKIKVSFVDAKEISAAAEGVIRANPAIMEMAKANVEARAKEAEALKEGLAQIVTPGMVNAQKKAKVEKEAADAKAKAKEVLSATQAGGTAIRPPKGQAKPQATA